MRLVYNRPYIRLFRLYETIFDINKEREVIVMNKLYLIPLILCLFLGAPSCKKAQEEPTPAVEEKVEKESQAPMIEEGEEVMEESGKFEAPIVEEGEVEE